MLTEPKASLSLGRLDILLPYFDKLKDFWNTSESVLHCRSLWLSLLFWYSLLSLEFFNSWKFIGFNLLVLHSFVIITGVLIDNSFINGFLGAAAYPDPPGLKVPFPKKINSFLFSFNSRFLTFLIIFYK